MKQSSRKREEDSLLAFIASHMICESWGEERVEGCCIVRAEKIEFPKLARISNDKGSRMNVIRLESNIRMENFVAKYIFYVNAFYRCVI